MFLRLFAALLLAGSASVLAQPANNNWANREVISALPFSDTESAIDAANTEAGDPVVVCRIGAQTIGTDTVWYSYTTGSSTEYVTISTAGSSYDTLVSVYTGSTGSFYQVTGGCSDESAVANGIALIAGLRLAPNTTYSIEVARDPTDTGTDSLTFNMSASALYAVNATGDTTPDGCTGGNCTLREAITAANAAAGAVIVPAGTYTLALTGNLENANATGDLDITRSMGIYGAGQNLTIVNGAAIDRVMHVDPAATGDVTVIFGDLTLRNGLAAGTDDATSEGAAVHVSRDTSGNYAAFQNVTLRDSLAFSHGGGIRSRGRTQFRNVTVTNNQAVRGGGGMFLSGGNDVTHEIRDSTIYANRSSQTTAEGGGGIYTIGRLRIVNSTISNNRSNFHGGGIHVEPSGSLVLSSSTVAGNQANSDSAGTGNGGGLRLDTDVGASAYSITNSIIADNIDLNMTAHPDCSRSAGTITSTYSLLEGTAGGCTFAGTGDATGVDAALGMLLDNGGTTLTHMPGPGPARDTGNPAGCTDFLNLTLAFDQRGAGYQRVFNTTCDKGAVEFQPIPAGTPTIPDLAPASDTGASNMDDITNDTTPTLTGTCQNGDTMEILDGATPRLPSAVCAGNMYSITLNALGADRLYNLSARATRDGSSVTTQPLAVTLDTTVVAPVITGPASSGSSTPTLTGTSEPNAAIEIFEGASPRCSTTANGAGAWTCTVSSALSVGMHGFTALQIDRAGNTSAPSSTFTVTVTDVLFSDGYE